MTNLIITRPPSHFRKISAMISGEEDIGKGEINKMIILENGDMMVVPEQILNVCETITKLNQQKHSSMSTLKNLMVEELIRKGFLDYGSIQLDGATVSANLCQIRRCRRTFGTSGHTRRNTQSRWPRFVRDV